MSKFIETIDSILDTIGVFEISEYSKKHKLYEYESAAIDLITEHLTKAGYTVSIMDTRYVFYPSGKNNSLHYVHPVYLNVCNNQANNENEQSVICLECEIYSSDCEQYLDDVRFKTYTQEEWNNINTQYINHLTKDELAMILSTAIDKI